MNTEKRLALCFALSILVILVFSWLNSKMTPIQRTQRITAVAAQTPNTGTPSLPQSPTTEPEAKKQVAAERTQGPWSWLPVEPPKAAMGEIVVESSLYRVVFSRTGGYPISWRLKQYEELFADPRYLELIKQSGTISDKQTADIELLFYKNHQKAGASPVEVINPIFSPGEKGLVVQWGNRSDRDIPYECARDHINITTSTEVGFVYRNSGIVLEKLYQFFPDSYHLKMQIRITNETGQPLSFGDENFYDVNWRGGFGLTSLRWDNLNSIHLQLDGKSFITQVDALKNEILRSQTGFLPEYPSPTVSQTAKSVDWVGLGPKYFLAAIVPLTPTEIALKGLSAPENANYGQVLKPQVGVRMPIRPIMDKTSHIDQFTLYVGPLEEETLQKAAAGLDEARQIFMRRIIGPIANLMLRLLKGFYAIVPNYGVGIILLTLLVKLLMFPFYHKQMASMKKMQALQPHLTALKEKYKDNQQQFQKEQMELFKKHKVNPLAGCLTMLPTIPIFIALYATFGMAMELRGAPFFGWIKDLSAPDSAFYLSVSGMIFTINILPIAYAALMLWSTSQQKVEGPNAGMMKIMPLMFVFFFWSIASGVILYFVISIFIDVMQRVVMDKFLSPSPATSSGSKKA